TARILADEVPGTVINRAVAILARILTKTRGSLLRVAVVAEADAGATDPQFARLSRRHRFLRVVEDRVREVRMHTPERREVAVGAREGVRVEFKAGADAAGLGWAIDVDKARAAREAGVKFP